MNDLPRQKLHEIIAEYSRSVCDDAQRCEGLLRDLCSGYKRETHALVSALRERVPHELLNTSSSGITKEVTIARLSKRLHDDLAMTEEAASWAVESWALALEVITAAEVGKFASKQVAPVPKVTSNQVATAPQYQAYTASDPNQSPEVRGFHMGMNLKEVLKQFSGLEPLSADEIGYQRIKLSVLTSSYHAEGALSSSGIGVLLGKKYPSLDGLKSLQFEFLDELLYSISLEYDESIKWNSIDEFAKKISFTLGLSGAWHQVGYGDKRGLRTLAYWLEVEKGVWGPALQLMDIQAERIRKERIAAKEDHQRRTFNL